MFIEPKTDRRAFFEDLYKAARQHLQDITDKLDLWYEQYKGSPAIDGSEEAASAVRNITYEIIESQIDSTIPAPKVDCKRYSERRDRCARSVERLCACLRDRLPFERLNDIDERYTYILGGSVWLVEWDAGQTEGGERGSVRVSCLSPRDFFPQPGISRVEDMEYCFLRFVTTRDELCRRWHADRADTHLAEAETEDAVRPDGDTVTVVVCYYKDEAGDICRFVWSGDLVLEDAPRYFYRKCGICQNCGRRRGACLCDKPDFRVSEDLWEYPDHDILLSDGRVIPARTFLPGAEGEDGALQPGGLCRTRLPYYVPKEFPIVIRRNTSCDRQLLGQSDCEFLRPIQQQINKVESRILQKLMRSAVTPVMPEDAQISLSNRVFGQVIKLRPGESASDYGTVDTTPDISRDIAQAERLYVHAKRLIGISDAFVGLDNVEISGYSRKLQLNQSAGRLESKRRMKYSAYADIDRLIFLCYLAFADEPRCVTYKDETGRIQNMSFNRYDFLEYDPEEGGYRYDDGYLFSVDLNGTLETQRDLMWQKNLENLQAGTLGDPSDPSTLLRYWQSQERVHYPYARENVEYFRSLTRGEEGAAVPAAKEDPHV